MGKEKREQSDTDKGSGEEQRNKHHRAPFSVKLEYVPRSENLLHREQHFP